MGFRSFAHTIRPELVSAGVGGLASSRLRTRELADACDELSVWMDVLVTTWEQYLRYGGYPEAVAAAREGLPIPEEFLDTLFDVVFRDAFGDGGSSVMDTLALLGRTAKGLGSPANMNAIADDSHVPAKTVRRRLDDLVEHYLAWPCNQVDADLRPRQRSRRKLYFMDPLLALLAHLRNDAWSAPDLTALAEQQLGLALLRGFESEDPGRLYDYDRVSFHRTGTDSEIDFVGSGLTGAALEGKYTEGGKWRGAARTVNASPWLGVLATRNVLDTTAPSDSWAVPAAMLAYLLDT